jgi:hypothetical protein
MNMHRFGLGASGILGYALLRRIPPLATEIDISSMVRDPDTTYEFSSTDYLFFDYARVKYRFKNGTIANIATFSPFKVIFTNKTLNITIS